MTRNVHRAHVTSTMLRSVGYDVTARTLGVEFNRGGVYQYYDVPAEVYEGLMAADSHGRYFNTHIRDRYRYNRVA